MIRKISVFCIYILSVISATSFACSQATATNDAGFCLSFKQAASCHCTNSGLPARMCTDMNVIYDRMIAVFKSVQKACEFQHDTTTQNCMESWQCYRSGGLNSRGEACSGTGIRCA